MTSLFENSTPYLVGGGLIEIVLGFILYKTRNMRWLYAMVVVLAIAGGLVAACLLIVTDRKLIKITLQTGADAVAANDTPGALSIIAPEARELRSYVKTGLAQVTLSAARIGRDLEITTNALTSPPSAIALFTAHVTGKARPGDMSFENEPLRLQIKLNKIGDRWLVTEYEQLPLFGH